MPDPLFEFFEVVAEELSATASKVITHEDLRAEDKDSPLLEALIKDLKATGSETAIPFAVRKLQEHFGTKGAKLPFAYDFDTGRFSATDPEFLSFVNEMRDIRSIGKRSRVFECRVAVRLSRRVKGSIHRVGHPRDKKRKQRDFNAHLQTLGFARPVLLGKEKDGGLDILWLLPVGSQPHRPIVTVQCKNGEFNMDVAHASVGTSSISLSQHGGLQPTVHVPCVLFNDYLHPRMLPTKQLNFVPLGLTDLASLEQECMVELI